MKEKETKDNKEQETKQDNPKFPKVIGRVVISIFDNGHVGVEGPIRDALAMMDVFGKSLSAVANFIAKEQQQAKVKSEMKK